VTNKYKGLIKSKMQQHLVNFSLSDAISIAKLDIDTDFKPAGLGVHGLHSANSTLPAGLGLRSANSSNLSAGLGLRSANSSNLSAGLGLHAASWNLNMMFKLVVASVKNKYSKGSSFTHLPTPNNNPISSFKFIVELASEGASQIILWTPCKLIDALSSEGAQFAPNFFQLGNFNSSKLIAMYSEISFHFCKDCRIFCEGVKEAIINAINRNNLPLLAFGLNMASGPAFGQNFASGAVSDHNMASLRDSGRNMASFRDFSRNMASF
jgi:hypothetical protein